MRDDLDRKFKNCGKVFWLIEKGIYEGDVSTREDVFARWLRRKVCQRPASVCAHIARTDTHRHHQELGHSTWLVQLLVQPSSPNQIQSTSKSSILKKDFCQSQYRGHFEFNISLWDEIDDLTRGAKKFSIFITFC